MKIYRKVEDIDGKISFEEIENIQHGEFRFPATGIWWVDLDEMAYSAKWIHKLADLPKLYPYLNVEKLRPIIEHTIINTTKKQYSISQLTTDIIKNITNELKRQRDEQSNRLITTHDLT